MKNPRRPLDIQENSALLFKRICPQGIDPPVAAKSRYTDEEMKALRIIVLNRIF